MLGFVLAYIIKRHYLGPDFGLPVEPNYYLVLLLFLFFYNVKLISPGPILFGQVRSGLNSRKFKVYKFRIMAVNAEALRDGGIPPVQRYYLWQLDEDGPQIDRQLVSAAGSQTPPAHSISSPPWRGDGKLPPIKKGNRDMQHASP